MAAYSVRGIEVEPEKIFPFLAQEEVFERISRELRYWPRMTSPRKEDRVNYLKQIMTEVESIGGKSDFFRMLSRHFKYLHFGSMKLILGYSFSGGQPEGSQKDREILELLPEMAPEQIRNYSSLSF